MDDQIRDIERRVTMLEQRDAVNSVQYKNIEKRLDRIDGHIGKLVWLVLGVIITSIVGFVVAGGTVPGV